MDREQAREIGERLGDIGASIRDLVEIGKHRRNSNLEVDAIAARLTALEKFQQDTLCWAGHLKSQLDQIGGNDQKIEQVLQEIRAEFYEFEKEIRQAVQAHDTETQALTARLEAIEKKVCDELVDKIVRDQFGKG